MKIWQNCWKNSKGFPVNSACSRNGPAVKLSKNCCEFNTFHWFRDQFWHSIKWISAENSQKILHIEYNEWVFQASRRIPHQWKSIMSFQLKFSFNWIDSANIQYASYFRTKRPIGANNGICMKCKREILYLSIWFVCIRVESNWFVQSSNACFIILSIVMPNTSENCI